MRDEADAPESAGPWAAAYAAPQALPATSTLVLPPTDDDNRRAPAPSPAVCAPPGGPPAQVHTTGSLASGGRQRFETTRALREGIVIVLTAPIVVGLVTVIVSVIPARRFFFAT
jgi:hypothetical protein